MGAIASGYAETEWGQVHYRRSGTSGPWIALFHESPLSLAVFERVLPILGERARAVAFDTPGYGASDPPHRNGFEIPDYARILVEAAGRIGMTRPILSGVHTGASIAIEAASQMAGGAAGLILTGVPLFTQEERAAFIADWTPPIPIDLEGSQFQWAVERYHRIWGPNLTADLLHLAVTEVLRVGERYDWGYQAAFRYDPAPLLAELDLPVLLLNAQFDVLAGKDAMAMAIAKRAELVVLEGLPGQMHLRAPAEYAGHILAFADRVR